MSKSILKIGLSVGVVVSLFNVDVVEAKEVEQTVEITRNKEIIMLNQLPSNLVSDIENDTLDLLNPNLYKSIKSALEELKTLTLTEEELSTAQIQIQKAKMLNTIEKIMEQPRRVSEERVAKREAELAKKREEEQRQKEAEKKREEEERKEQEHKDQERIATESQKTTSTSNNDQESTNNTQTENRGNGSQGGSQSNTFPPTQQGAKDAFNAITAEYGISGWEKDGWASIIKRESNWNPTIWNSQGSGAYGLPQALPGNKMASAGSDWKTNPYTQLKWMYSYMVGRYGSIGGAVSFWNANRWY